MLNRQTSFTNLLLILRAAAPIVIGLVIAAPITAAAEDTTLPAAPSSEIAAEVDGRPIYRKQVDTLALARAGEDLPSLDREDIQSLKKQVVEDLIDRSLLLEVARVSTPSPTAAEIRQVLADAKVPTENGTAPLAGYLGQATEENLREVIRDDLWIKNYFSAIDSSIVIPDDEVRTVYELQQNSFKEPEQFHLKEILLTIPPDSTRDKIRERAAEIADQLRAGTLRFDEAVRLYSSGPARDRAGDMGFVSENQVPAAPPSVHQHSPQGSRST